MAAPDLDRWLDDQVLRVFHHRSARTGAVELWRAAGGVRLAECRRLGRLVRWRIPGVASETTYRELLRREPFTLLDEGDGWSVSGLVGRIWTIRRDYPSIGDPERFATWRPPACARVLMAHWVEPDGDGSAVLCSETRVAVDDRRARVGVELVRPLVSRFQQLIASEPLEVAVRRAENGAEPKTS